MGGVRGVCSAVSAAFANQGGEVIIILQSNTLSLMYSGGTYYVQTHKERIDLLASLCNYYFVIQGAEGSRTEAQSAQKNGAIIIPIARTGGTAAELYSSMNCPDRVVSNDWKLLNLEQPKQLAEAAVKILKHLLHTSPLHIDEPSLHKTKSIDEVADTPFVAPLVANRYALLIGINEYNDKQSLNGCINDVALIQEVLNSFGILPSNITRLLDNQAKKAQIIATIQDLSEKIKDSDDVILYFSGHGRIMHDDNDMNNIASILSYDGEISSTELVDLLGTIKCSKTFILDSSYSGIMVRNFESSYGILKPYWNSLPPICKYNDMLFIASCKHNEVAKEQNIEGNVYEEFTYQFCNNVKLLVQKTQNMRDIQYVLELAAKQFHVRLNYHCNLSDFQYLVHTSRDTRARPRRKRSIL